MPILRSFSSHSELRPVKTQAEASEKANSAGAMGGQSKTDTANKGLYVGFQVKMAEFQGSHLTMDV